MDRRPSLADILNPEQIRQYMAEAGYAQPVAAYPVPPPMDVPVAPPADLVEYRGTIEFQAHWELPAVANRSRDELIADILSTLSGQEAAWLPRLRYRVANLTRIDPNARPLAPAQDPRPRWRHPTNGTLWRVNQDGSLDPESGTPPVATPNAWMAAEMAPAARREMDENLRDIIEEKTPMGPESTGSNDSPPTSPPSSQRWTPSGPIDVRPEDNDAFVVETTERMSMILPHYLQPMYQMTSNLPQDAEPPLDLLMMIQVMETAGIACAHLHRAALKRMKPPLTVMKGGLINASGEPISS